MDNNLTDRSFWKAFWESRIGLIFNIKRDYIFGDMLGKIKAKKGYQTAIELGGFPGYYTIYLKKYENMDTTLFDYFVHQGLVNELLEVNGLKETDIDIIEADLFSYQPETQYDMVLSFGLIEHFKDTKAIIATHLPFLKDNGTLFITLPNFKSINGWVQRKFDLENYNKHYIESMNPALLASYCKELGLKDVESYYHGKFSMWLENKGTQSALAKAFVKSLWFTGKVFTKIFPFESKALSPYIVLKATK
ncbi:class I SAM-dependent methyltransferase [Mucilaginibacter sp. UYCu711]|uniref:class I SAM-dependent methyltransferase n=1 Tax=Mucilaginibacter sp. UYCu711 TaxID=3156339 RepID=UPI003D24F69F